MLENELRPHAERLLQQLSAADRAPIEHLLDADEQASVMWFATNYGARNDLAAATALQAYIDSNPRLPETTIEGAAETIALLRQAA